MKKTCECRKRTVNKSSAKSLAMTVMAKKKSIAKAKVRCHSTYILTWGENKIELSSRPHNHVIVYEASSNLPNRRVGKGMRRLAEILKKSHSVNLRRLGYDILEENCDETNVKQNT